MINPATQQEGLQMDLKTLIKQAIEDHKAFEARVAANTAKRVANNIQMFGDPDKN